MTNRGAARRREPRAPKRKLRRKLPRAARFAKAIQPPDGPIIAYRLAMRRTVAKWWASIGPKALGLAKQIGKSDESHADANEESSDAAVHLSDAGTSEATSYLTGQLGGITKNVERHNDAQFKRIGIPLEKSAPGVAKMVPGFRKENVGLIKTMLDSEKSKIELLLKEGGNRRVESLAKDIEARLGIATRHAELIARDQTLKLNAAITRQRMTNAGITSYVWTTAGDERVRPKHDELDGEQFNFDDPPVTNEDGDTNNPGEDYQCRCVPFPILPELEDESQAPEVDDEPSEGYLAENSNPAEAAEYERELEDKTVPDEVEEAGHAPLYRELLRGVDESELKFLRTGYREPLTVLEGLAPAEATKLTTGEKIPKGSRRPLPPIKIAIYPGDEKPVLVDGRHRMAAAQRAGATKIRSTIIQYDDELNILWRGDRIIKTPRKS